MTSSDMSAPLWVDIDPAGAMIVHGDIDIAGGPILDSILAQHETSRPVVIDLSDVSFVDSSGLRSLLGASRRAAERDERVTLRGVGSEVRRLLEITGTTDLFETEMAS